MSGEREGDGSQVSIPVDERTFLRFSLRASNLYTKKKREREKKEELISFAFNIFDIFFENKREL